MKKLITFMLTAALSIGICLTSFASTEIGLNLDWKYAANSKINTGKRFSSRVMSKSRRALRLPSMPATARRAAPR